MATHIFQSSRLVYNPIEQKDEHSDFFQKLRSEAEYTSSAPYLPRPGGKEIALEVRKRHVNDRLALFICLPQDNDGFVPIGTMSLSKLGPDDMVHHSAGTISIVLLKEYHRKGYGAEALQWLMWYSFEVAHLHRLGLFCGGWNKGAQRLYEKIGFVPEGRQREAVWMLGTWHDRVGFGMLEREWKILPNRFTPFPDGNISSDHVARLLNSE